MLQPLTVLTLIVSAVPLVVAASYLAWPSGVKLVLMRPFSLAACFSIAAGTLSGFMAALQRLTSSPETAVSGSHFILTMSEALASTAVGMASLSVAWLLVAAGMLGASSDEA